LFETFLEERIESVEHIFKNYTLYWVRAVRSQARGRASGGALYGIKKNLNGNWSGQYVMKGNCCAIEILSYQSKICVLPVYLNCNNWENDFNELYESLLDLGADDVMILGDLNARCGDEQLFNISSESSNEFYSLERLSKDANVDSNGRKLTELCSSFSLTALNGRARGDKEGNFTFCRGTAHSVIDYCLVRGDIINNITSFEVDDMIVSDHQPLSVTLNISAQPSVNNRPLNPLPRFKWHKAKEEMYKAKLHQLSSTLTADNYSIEDLVACVKDAANSCQRDVSQSTRIQPWFDRECEYARRKSFSALRKAKRIGTDENFMEYQMANRAFKEMCANKKSQYFENLASKLKGIKDSKEYWSVIKELNGTSFTKGPHLNATCLEAHFQSLLNRENSVCTYSYALPFISDDGLDVEITVEEVEKALEKAKLNKAPGPDGIPTEFYKYVTPNFVEMLTVCFNHMFNTGSVSASFCSAIIFPLFKQGDVNDPNNYRGISFQNAIAKIFTYILHERLVAWVDRNSLLSEFQAGFRKGYSTVDNIFCLNSISQHYLLKKKKLYALFVDFKAAFDSIVTYTLFYKLSNIGISSKMLAIIQSLYANNFALVWDGETTSEPFATETGVKQGCLLSPLLFALFLDDLVTFLPNGITCFGVEIKVLMYADDIVILAETPSALQRMINKLGEYCKDWGLTVNTNKTKVLIFRRAKGRYRNDEKWHLNGLELEKVKQYKYLGVLLTSNGTFHKHIDEKLKSAKTAINCTWKSVLGKKHVAHSVKYKLFEAAVRSVMGYASEIWGLERYEEAEKLLRYFIKKLFRLPRNTPNYMIHLETGLPEIYVNFLKNHFQYISRVMDMNDNRLPKKIALHLLQTKTQCFQKWESLAAAHNEPLMLHDIPSWKQWQCNILKKIDIEARNQFLIKAQESTVRRSYPTLEHNLCQRSYFRDDFSIEMISNIFRARGELLKLNYLPHIELGDTRCSLCNAQEEENILHFLGKCAVLREFRILLFGKTVLSRHEQVELLNGKNWSFLYQYVQAALKYRKQILEEAF